MNTYIIVPNFKTDSGVVFKCLFEIEEEPFELKRIKNASWTYEIYKYRIKKVVIGSNKLMFKYFLDKNNEKRYKFKFKNSKAGFRSFITYIPELNHIEKKIIEFPDDKSALLWFKLEYGG